MLKKRLIGVITVKNGWAVQSFGYQRYLPLGRPECLAENLDRWGADEILVLSIDRSGKSLGPDFDLLRRLGSLALSTPLTYGGGIRTVEDAGAVIQLGADRLCVDALLRDNPAVVRDISALIGAQAVIGVMPVSIGGRNQLQWHNYRLGTDEPFSLEVIALFEDRVVSEAMIVDWRNEGQPRAFNAELLMHFPVSGVPLIAFGGISQASQIDALFSQEAVVAVGVGNFLSYVEHAVQKFKQQIGVRHIRTASFSNEI